MGAMSKLLDQALLAAHEAADAAAAVIRRYYASDTLQTEQKDDATPVTIADREAETAIATVLRRHFPGHAMLGEEHGRQGEGSFLWLVDPIDGTRAFVRGYPFFSTQIALQHEGEIVLGLSNVPISGERAWAVRGRGACIDGARVQVSAQAQLDEHAALSTGNLRSLAANPAGWQVLAGLIGRVGRIRGYGDYLHYHLLARGSIDVVIESDVDILDIAALSIIVREAGGVFTDLHGNAPSLGITSVLAGNPALHAMVLAQLRTAGYA